MRRNAPQAMKPYAAEAVVVAGMAAAVVAAAETVTDADAVSVTAATEPPRHQPLQAMVLHHPAVAVVLVALETVMEVRQRR